MSSTYRPPTCLETNNVVDELRSILPIQDLPLPLADYAEFGDIVTKWFSDY